MMKIKEFLLHVKPRFYIYGNRKLIAALEYGLVIGDVAKNNNITITEEMVSNIENMIINEFSSKNVEKLAVEMIPNILSCFDTK